MSVCVFWWRIALVTITIYGGLLIQTGKRGFGGSRGVHLHLAAHVSAIATSGFIVGSLPFVVRSLSFPAGGYRLCPLIILRISFSSIVVFVSLRRSCVSVPRP